MPVGPRSATDGLQCTVDLILSGLQFKTFVVYLDDVLMLSKSIEDHIKNVSEVLQLLRDGGSCL